MPTSKRAFKPIAVNYRAINKWYTRAYGCLLLRGNEGEFPNIRKHLARLNVEYQEIPIGNGGTYFVFPETELRKLPTWEKKRFLPADESGETGHSVYHVTVFQLAGLL